MTLLSFLKTKLVCQILVNTEDGMGNYTCFNDALQRSLTKLKNAIPTAYIPLNTLKKLLLTLSLPRGSPLTSKIVWP